MDKIMASKLHKEMLDALAEVAKRNGVTIALGGGTCGETTVLKFKVSEIRAQIGTGDLHVLTGERDGWVAPNERLDVPHTRFPTREAAIVAKDNLLTWWSRAVVVELEDFSEKDAEWLNSYYEQEIGYRPQEDDPTMTLEHLRALCEDISADDEGPISTGKNFHDVGNG